MESIGDAKSEVAASSPVATSGGADFDSLPVAPTDFPLVVSAVSLSFMVLALFPFLLSCAPDSVWCFPVFDDFPTSSDKPTNSSATVTFDLVLAAGGGSNAMFTGFAMP
jgi:hypothetical protein